jgi:hypothetical protein
MSVFGTSQPSHNQSLLITIFISNFSFQKIIFESLYELFSIHKSFIFSNLGYQISIIKNNNNYQVYHLILTYFPSI